MTTAQSCDGKNIALVTGTFPLLPSGKVLKKEPDGVTIYQYDESPLGSRSPFLLVHGLRGEFYQYFRWQKVAKKLSEDESFNSRFKIYCARYPTLRRLDKVTPKFREAVEQLYGCSKNRQISVLALSMGGNVVYESMLDPSLERKIRVLMTMGTPFHGSPLFCEDWMQYSLYKRLSWPWTRIDHSLAIRLYFNRNRNLLEDLSWDDSDRAIPDVGKFRSSLPLGPRGDLTVADTLNERLKEININHRHLKKKLITYGGYLDNPYLDSKAIRFIESAAMYPVTLLWVKFPAHLAREHPVLRVLNRDIACVSVTKEWKSKEKSPFLYALNDGITPLASALFLPEEVLSQTALTVDADIEKIKDKTDVRLARVFKNIDHLTYIDGFRPLGSNAQLKDSLNPKDGGKTIFEWILSDILDTESSVPNLASDSDHPNIQGETKKVHAEAQKLTD